MLKEHLCALSKKQNCATIYKDDPYWVLLLFKQATEDDLESNHYLENIGEPFDQVIVPIVYCPYCGEKLESGVVMEQASYQCFDSSQW